MSIHDESDLDRADCRQYEDIARDERLMLVVAGLPLRSCERAGVYTAARLNRLAKGRIHGFGYAVAAPLSVGAHRRSAWLTHQASCNFSTPLAFFCQNMVLRGMVRAYIGIANSLAIPRIFTTSSTVEGRQTAPGRFIIPTVACPAEKQASSAGSRITFSGPTASASRAAAFFISIPVSGGLNE